jgi:hypothetical protein
VVRGGVTTPEQLANGASPIPDEPGLCQISVAFQPGRTVEQLVAVSRFPNRQISVTTAEALIAAGAVEIRQTPGRNPVHGDIIAPCNAEGEIAPTLLQALAGAFVQRPNPGRIP